MAAINAVGPKASSIKYDIISAMLAHGLSQNKQTQRRVMRLLLLVTARYNWRNNDLTIGHKEIAKLWSVDPRTVKREMALFKDLGWIKVKRQGARGRVGSYQICVDALMTLSQPTWSCVGPDFETRAMALLGDVIPKPKVVQVDFGADRKNKTLPTGKWRDVCDALEARHPEIYINWFSRLSFVASDGDHCILRAPSRFVARYIETHFGGILMAELRQVFLSARRLTIQV